MGTWKTSLQHSKPCAPRACATPVHARINRLTRQGLEKRPSLTHTLNQHTVCHIITVSRARSYGEATRNRAENRATRRQHLIAAPHHGFTRPRVAKRTIQLNTEMSAWVAKRYSQTQLCPNPPTTREPHIAQVKCRFAQDSVTFPQQHRA